MSLEITVDQANTVIENDGEVLYQVAFEVVASEGVSLALFTYQTADDAYSHPSTVYDLDAYPDSKNEAVNLGLDFYRQPTVTRQFSDVVDAEEFARITKIRLQNITNALPQMQAGFVGQTTWVFTPVSR